MKTLTQLLSLAILSALVSIGCNHEKNTYCDNSQRYNLADATDWEADNITQEEATVMINRFYDSTKVNRSPEDTVKGLFISKEVLDSIFRDPKLNGITVYFAQSKTNDYQLLFEGTIGTAINYKGGNTTPMLKPKPPVYCPPSCGSIPPSEPNQ